MSEISYRMDRRNRNQTPPKTKQKTKFPTFMYISYMYSFSTMWSLKARIASLFVSLCYIALPIHVEVVEAFRIPHHHQCPTPSFVLKFRSTFSALDMAVGGRGMSKSAKMGDKVATGMGQKGGTEKKGSAKATPFNVNASLARLEKKYDELTKANAKVIRKKDKDDDDDDADDDRKDDPTTASTDDNATIEKETNTKDHPTVVDDDDDDDRRIVTSEYVVAVRAEGYVSDWVPIAQFCLARTSQQASVSDGVTDPAIQAGVSYYCRELSHVATLGSRIFQSIPRNLLQYSVETLDSFHKHVYETTISTSGGSQKDDPTNTNRLTKQDAREVLELVNGEAEDKSAIKRAYRTKSFAYHPDRFVGVDRTAEEIELAHTKYLRIQLAYDTLNSGIRSTSASSSTISWYQSLGGKARTDFVGPVSLLSIENGKSILETNQIESAITSMSPSIVQTFVTRCM